MNYSKETLEKSRIKITVEVAPEEWQEAINSAYNKTKGKFNIEGFRKGKAPRKVIERMYGVSVFFEDALDVIIPKAYGEVLDKEPELDIVARPDVDVLAISDTEVKLAYTVTVKPEIKVGKYTGLELKKIEYPVTDEMVDAEVKKAQDRASSWENVTDRAAAKGDMTVIDFEGKIDGVKFDGGTAEKQNLELGSGMFIPGFEEQVEGMNIGETKDIKVNFPADYGVEELNGKEAVFTVVLHEIKTKIMPEVNDEFVKDVSEFDTVDEYKADIRASLVKSNEAKAESDTENAILDAIAETTEVEIPDAMVENQIDEMIREFEYRLMYQGMKLDDYYKYTNTNRDLLAMQYKETAAKNVKIRLILEAIVKAEGLKVEDDEMEAKIADFAKGANKSVEEYKKDMNPNQFNYMANEIVTDKLFAFLKDNNKFN